MPVPSARPTPSCSIRTYRDGDEAGLLQLFNAAFRAWPHVTVSVDPIEHLVWKLRSTPDSIRYQVIAESEGMIVGALLFIVQEIKARNRTMLSRQGVDGCVHPAYQNQGIMSEMRRFARDRFAGVFDLYLGGQTTHPAMVAIGARDGGELFGNQIEIWSRPAGLPAPPPIRERLAWTVTAPSVFDDRIDEFWSAASSPFDFIVVRTRNYLNWRYADIRGGPYTIKLAEHDGQVLGYAVLGISRGRGHLADLLVLPERLDVARSLLREAVAFFAAEGVAARCYTVARHPYNDVLRAEGFVRLKEQRAKYRVLKAGEELAFLSSRDASLHLTSGDWDGV